jgi:hypothetical protein
LSLNFIKSNVFKILNHIKFAPVVMTLVFLNISDFYESFLDVLLLGTLVIYVYSIFDYLEIKFLNNFFADSVNLVENEFNLIYFLERVYLRFKASPFLALN